jgi:hypothetical protein
LNKNRVVSVIYGGRGVLFVSFQIALISSTAIKLSRIKKEVFHLDLSSTLRYVPITGCR